MVEHTKLVQKLDDFNNNNEIFEKNENVNKSIEIANENLINNNLEINSQN